ncbi:MAG TPA: hypothetical protein DHW02_06055 [Ktedonobacter sp.]|nr:hypothetical protein [Ktedonobacter sp.]
MAIDALRAAGFGYDQVGVASQTGQDNGSSTNNLSGDLTNLGLPQDQASYYDNQFRQGNTVVSVRPDGRDDEAMNILRTNGAYDYNNQGQMANTSNYTQTGTADTVNTYDQSNTNANYANTGTYNNQTDTQQAMPLREEQLNVNKERVQAGEVQLHKDVVEEQKTVNVPVTHEEVYVERRPVTDGQVDNTPIGQDETIRVPVSEEQVEVTKTPVVTGEVAVGKRAVQENQQVSDTVRREEARLDESGNPVVQGENAFNNATNQGNTYTNDNTNNQ